MEENKDLIPEDVLDEQETEDTQEDLHGENLGDRVRVLSPTMLVLKRFFRSKLSVIGLVTLIVLFALSFIGPFFSMWTTDGFSKPKKEYLETEKVIIEVEKVIYLDAEGKEVVLYNIMEHPTDLNKRGEITWFHWLGTNDNGEDIFTNLLLGGRVSLTLGFVVIFIEALIGVILGGISGYFGGWIDNLIMRIVDILSCIPSIPIMLIVSSILNSMKTPEIVDAFPLIGDGWKLYVMMGILTLIGWVGIARLVRGQILSLREQEFMLAAKSSGLSTFRKIFKHLLPNVMPQLIVSMTMGLGSIILTEATLGFLGLAPMDTPTWGQMINSATKMDLLIGYPNYWVPPGICITLAILAFNFVGDGLRDAFDPKMKR